MENTTENQTPEQNQDPASRIKYSSEPVVNQDEELERLKSEQNLPLGIAGGLAAAVLGAYIWAVITVWTGYQIGYMAIGLGFIVGFSVQFLGKGVEQIFGISGAVLALLGCILGNLFSVVGYSAVDGMGYWETFTLLMDIGIFNILSETFGFMDLLFYGIAVYEGYRFSFRTMV